MHDLRYVTSYPIFLYSTIYTVSHPGYVVFIIYGLIIHHTHAGVHTRKGGGGVGGDPWDFPLLHIYSHLNGIPHIEKSLVCDCTICFQLSCTFLLQKVTAFIRIRHFFWQNKIFNLILRDDSEAFTKSTVFLPPPSKQNLV